LELSHQRKLGNGQATGAAHLRWARWVDDEHIIAVVDRTLGLWNIVSGEQIYAIDDIDHRAVPAISGGRRYVAVPSSGAVDLYATTTAQPLGRIEIENRVPGVSFSPPGDVLSIVTSRRMRAWDLTSATLSADITCRRSLGDGQPIWIDSDLLLSSSGVLLSLLRGLPIWRYDIAGTETVSIGKHIAMVRRHPTPEITIVSLPHEAAANAMRWIDSSPAKVDLDRWRILGQSSWGEAGWLDRDVQISARPRRLR
jgi:WD40 repeat protein